MEEEINLVDYFRVIWRRKYWIVGVTLSFTIAAVFYSLIATKTYLSQATILTQGKTGAGASLSQALSGTGLVGLMAHGEISPADHLLIILKSRTLAEEAVERYELRKSFYSDLWDSEKNLWRSGGEPPRLDFAVDHLFDILSFEKFKRTGVQIIAEHQDPIFATKLVNSYVKALADYIRENALTSGKRERVFVAQELERNKMELLALGKQLAEFYSANKISNSVPTVDVDVSVVDQSEGEARFVELPADEERIPFLSGVHFPKVGTNYSFLSVPDANAALLERGATIERQVNEFKSKLNQPKVIRDVPQQVYLQYLTGYRELLGKVNILLAQQYEMAKIQEEKDGLSFSVIDWARVPYTRFKPNRTLIVFLTFLSSLLLSVFLVFFMDYLNGLKEKSL